MSSSFFISLSLADLSRSSVPLIWEICNENFGFFAKAYGSIFYRELNSIHIPDPDFDPESEGAELFVRFSDYFERKEKISYDMGNSLHQSKSNKLLDCIFGQGAAARACASIDQSPMQFLIAYFLQELSARHENQPLLLKKKDLVRIDYDEKGEFRLRVKFQIQGASAPEATYPISIPFDVTVEAEFSILKQGVQLKGISLEGKDSEFARSLLMGGVANLSLLDRIKLSCHEGEETFPHADPLVALVMISPSAAIGLCEAIAMGADISPVRELARMTELNVYKFLNVIGSFVSGGNLESLLEMGPVSVLERQKLKRRLPEIKERFLSQLELMKTLCGEESPGPAGASKPLFGDSPEQSTFLGTRRRLSIRVSHLERFNRRHSAPSSEAFGEIGASEQEGGEGNKQGSLEGSLKKPHRSRSESPQSF